MEQVATEGHGASHVHDALSLFQVTGQLPLPFVCIDFTSFAHIGAASHLVCLNSLLTTLLMH